MEGGATGLHAASIARVGWTAARESGLRTDLQWGSGLEPQQWKRFERFELKFGISASECQTSAKKNSRTPLKLGGQIILAKCFGACPASLRIVATIVC
jgi:hypothetical protein